MNRKWSTRPTTSRRTSRPSDQRSINTCNDGSGEPLTTLAVAGIGRPEPERRGRRRLRLEQQALASDTGDRQVQHAAFNVCDDAPSQPVDAILPVSLKLHHANVVQAAKLMAHVTGVQFQSARQRADACSAEHEVADDLQAN